MNKIFNRLAVAGSALFVGAAQAAISTTDVTTAITDAGAAIAIVGAAVLVMFVGGKAFKWIRSAL